MRKRLSHLIRKIFSAREQFSFLNKNIILKFFEKLLVVITLLTLIVSSSISIYDYLYKNVLDEIRVRDKVDKIYPGVSVEYIETFLGKPIYSQKLTSTTTEHYYYDKPAWIQVLEDEDNNVNFWAITWCGNTAFDLSRDSTLGTAHTVRTIDERGDVTSERITKPFRLGNSTFSDVGLNSKEFHLFISGATSNSYAWESSYFGNPGGYLTYYLGKNDSCYRFGNLGISESEFKNTETVNTYGEAIDPVDDILYSNSYSKGMIMLGPDRIKIRAIK